MLQVSETGEANYYSERISKEVAHNSEKIINWKQNSFYYELNLLSVLASGIATKRQIEIHRERKTLKLLLINKN